MNRVAMPGVENPIPVAADGARDFHGRPPRALIYSHDTYGLGHLRRCLKISKALKDAYPDISILLVTGSPHAGRYPLPEDVDFVKLPAVVKTSAYGYRPRSLGGSFSDVLELRQNIIFEAVRTFDPNLLIVDHSPLGMKGEVLKTLLWLRQQNSPCHKILGLRDVIDSPETVIASWKAEGVYEVLDKVYDQIVIYGTQEFFDPVRSYQFSESAYAKTSFVGFITSGFQDYGLTPQSERDDGVKEVFITVGGGEDGVEIIETYLNMLSRHGKRLNARSTIVTGPFFPEPAKSLLSAFARTLQVEFLDFVPDISLYLQRADLVVSMGGYNTATEILSNAGKALIIPRSFPRKEQLIRAQRLSEMGLVSYIAPEQLNPDDLYETVSTLLSKSDKPLVEARKKGVLALDGGAQMASLCHKYLEAPIEVS